MKSGRPDEVMGISMTTATRWIASLFILAHLSVAESSVSSSLQPVIEVDAAREAREQSPSPVRSFWARGLRKPVILYRQKSALADPLTTVEINESGADESTADRSLETPVAELARCFQSISTPVQSDEDSNESKGRRKKGLREGKDDQEGDKDIDVSALLTACEKLKDSMKNIGMSQVVVQDLDNNIKKIQALQSTVCEYVGNQKWSFNRLSQLLEFEKDVLRVHDQADRGQLSSKDDSDKSGKHQIALKDPSGAIGSLWIRRSLSFQCRMYELLLGSGGDSADSQVLGPREAVMMAYESELEPFHSWPLRKLWGVGMRTFVPAEATTLFAKFGGFESSSGAGQVGSVKPVNGVNDQALLQRAVRRDVQNLVDAWKPLITRWKQIHIQLNLEDTRRS